ncbi:AlpA family phage regulatory protein [Legionella anisa]|uniref:AlpA family phage regulatory protein n=1 Tax=Legionella anisa TaxID=28082 RepID=A0AAX0WVP8_9GAMM|nr:AlpA family phage regulatory protein [Legionella anisa]MDW9132342.1 AlpA family phage regulatory protein [Legionella pneumophila]AWN73440.1 AlpA family phage regulatory protein [Legionella anisa]KTC66936.1 prophage regulatory protein-like protein [Legionella anisa]MBN5934225.1 AlpA family phage regulatory protein [Legionella anisa]MCW8426311.1 AlpA family phage regulatory protein [Legionella anisa]
MEKFENKIPKQILFITDLERLIGRNRLTLRRWWTSGKFPEPVKLNGTTLAWHQETITHWIDKNIRLSL